MLRQRLRKLQSKVSKPAAVTFTLQRTGDPCPGWELSVLPSFPLEIHASSGDARPSLGRRRPLTAECERTGSLAAALPRGQQGLPRGSGLPGTQPTQPGPARPAGLLFLEKNSEGQGQ